MTPRSALVVALSIGVALGACAREAIRGAVSTAHAQEVTPKKTYMVRGGSRSESGYENDLNRLAEEGWHFVTTIKPRGDDPSYLVFER